MELKQVKLTHAFHADKKCGAGFSLRMFDGARSITLNLTPNGLKHPRDKMCSERQGLKPFSIQRLYGTVETVPYKDFLVATQAPGSAQTRAPFSLYSRLCSHHKNQPIKAPVPIAPRMNGRARGTARNATTAIPIDTTAPTFVPGTGIFPKASRCGGAFCRSDLGSNTSRSRNLQRLSGI
jgi:hypothetical protein